MANLGKPTELDDDKQTYICVLLMEGNTRQAVADAVGIDPRTLRRWIQWGREGKSDLFVRFSHAVKEAEAWAEIARLRRIEQAGKNGTWQADAWWLERRRGRHYALRERKILLDIQDRQNALAKAFDAFQSANTAHHLGNGTPRNGNPERN